MVQHGRTELVEGGIGQLHLRLDTHGSGDVPADGSVGQVTQQRALAHARLAPQDGDPAPAGERIGHEPVERLTLASASEELQGLAAILTHRRPPCTVQRCSRYHKIVYLRSGPGEPADQGSAPGCLPGAMQPPKRKGDSCYRPGRNCRRERRRRLEKPWPPQSTPRPRTASGTCSGRPSWSSGAAPASGSRQPGSPAPRG